MLEEEVLDTHKAVMENTTSFLNDAHSVFSATHEVDYDTEGKNIFLSLFFLFFQHETVFCLLILAVAFISVKSIHESD